MERGSGDSGIKWGRKGSGEQVPEEEFKWDVGSKSWEQRIQEGKWGRKGSQEVGEVAAKRRGDGDGGCDVKEERREIGNRKPRVRSGFTLARWGDWQRLMWR